MKFDFFSAPRIVFGVGVISRLGEFARSMGKNATIIYNGPIASNDLVLHALRAVGIETTGWRQVGEPTMLDVDTVLRGARQVGCDMVVGIGGGSAIDCAKAVAGLLTNGGDALDYMEVVGKGQKITKPAAPWIAVPTTAGTGAEVTRNAVIGYPEKSFKASIRSELLLPRVALIDPQLGVGVPAQVTAASGMDALCQCIEAYTSSGANPMTDALALEGVRLAARSLKHAYENPGNLEARGDMAMAALLSGIALTNAGLGAVHGFAAPLGAAFPVPHGVVCAALLPGVIAANVAALRAASHATLGRYVTLGRTIGGQHLAADEAIDAVIRTTRTLAQELAIPRLGNFGITAAQVPGIVELAQKASSMKFNPVVLPKETLQEVLLAAL